MKNVLTRPESPYKVGDRVVFIAWDGPTPPDDEPGTVIDVNKRGSVIVRWDDDASLLAFHPEELEHVR